MMPPRGVPPPGGGMGPGGGGGGGGGAPSKPKKDPMDEKSRKWKVLQNKRYGDKRKFGECVKPEVNF